MVSVFEQFVQVTVIMYEVIRAYGLVKSMPEMLQDTGGMN
jgi:hypothetical protein